MVDARVIALVLGIVGAAFGISALILDVAALGAVSGFTALGAGVVALWGSRAPSASVTVEDIVERDRAIDRARAELADALTEIEALRSAVDDRTREQDRTREVETGTAPTGGPVTSGDSEGLPAQVEPSALTDTDSQLFSQAYFQVALQSRLASARRHLRPVSVCLIEVTEGQADAAGGSAPAGRVADAIRQTIREADIACRMDDGTFAVILEDTPENGAVWTVERTRRNLVSRFGTHTMWAGVACYPAHAFSGDELIGQARTALRSAQEWNQDRIEVAAVEG